MTTQATVASAARHYGTPPQISADGEQTWITRGANFVVCVTHLKAGAVLARPAQDDEYMVLLADAAARIDAGDHHCDAAAQTLTIVPPGASRITARADGLVVRVFSHKAVDLAAMAGNAQVYAAGAPEVAPLEPWPDPTHGFALRNYVLAEHTKPDTNMRIFRSTNLMLNIMTPRMVARDVHKLSPHVHADFEQGSLALSGEWVHHLRHPWTADMTTWRDDEHIQIGSPSLTVIPPKVIHTSNNVNDGGAWLVDVFAPPRLDFSKVPGKVANADDYPMPAAH
ncbi:MAG: hypothetical protein KDH93_19240 [Rhodoferax sp.]|nr:hypothetical protein [Rhodoferax sp.]MCB2007160.1 hypothetical protein [Rhodoferax sp.]MCB2028598.1 hypothetical protein [Rhodoferax sp.]MCB2041728.1 hypothetical protein [Rhodoferax sp.]MCP5262390.1 hypothetical protein [Rhodoferax sp.]